jgi:drug/metabolite transporter (DMT)-like permease
MASQQKASAYKLLFLTVVLRPFGNLSMAWGMRHFGPALGANPLLYAEALFHPYVALGIGLLIVSLLTRMALLSVADLSFVLPLTAMGYIVSTVLGKFVLDEQVSLGHWAGTLLVFAGVALVSSTSLRTGSARTSVKMQRAQAVPPNR